MDDDSTLRKIEPQTGKSDSEALIPETPQELGALERIFRLLFKTTHVDFSHYRKNTILRRLARRIALRKQSSFEDYLQLLEREPTEIRLLYDDLLLSYTEFFREPEVFAELKKQVFPKLTECRSARETIRIWVPGCSTGEEVYSLAICYQDFLQEQNLKAPGNVQFFGTDLNSRHIDVARAAVYPDKVRNHLSPTQIDTYFDQVPQGLKITKHIREMCVFAVQNITEDPPFAHIDLVSCRNVLIYFDSAFQETAIPLFHFSLRDEGFLLLGSAETVGRFPELFSLVDQKINLYMKCYSASAANYRFPVNLQNLKFQKAKAKLRTATTNPVEAINISKQIDSILLDAYAPPCVLVDNNLIIRQFRGKNFPFFEPVAGIASLKLSKIVGDALMPELYVAIEEARKKQGKIKKNAITFRQAEAIITMDISVLPVTDPAAGDPCFLIIFEKSDVKLIKDHNSSLSPGELTGEQNTNVKHLQEELQSIKEYLQSIIEEKDDVNQELWAANEEVQSANEELQSINEEMEAAKEELESSNEELVALNEELQDKNSELKQAKDFTEKLIETAQAFIVMLDAEARIILLNKYAEKLTGYKKEELIHQNWFNTFIPKQESDKIDIVFNDVLKRAPEVAQFENAIITKSGEQRQISWSNNVLRNADGHIYGTFSIGLDVTEHRQAEKALKESEEKYRALVETSQDLIWQCDAAGSFTYLNPAWESTLGYTMTELLGKNITSFLVPADVGRVERELALVAKGGKLKGYEMIFTAKQGQELNLVVNAVSIQEPSGKISGFRGTAHNVTEWKKAEQKYQMLFNEMLDGFALHEIINDREGKPVDYRFLAINPAFERLTGLKAHEIIGKTVREVLPDIEPYWIETYGRVANYGEPAFFENYAADLEKYFTVTAFSFIPGQFACIFIDITKRKQAENALRESAERFDQLAKQTRTFLWEVNAEGLFTFVGPNVKQVLGYQPEELVGRMHFYDLHPEKGREAFKANGFTYFRRKEKIVDSHHLALAKDGRQIWLSTHGLPVLGKNGELSGYQGGDTDINDRKLAEAMQLDYEQHQQQAQRLESLGILAGGIAHDFNNLLGGIFAFIDLAFQESQDNSKASNYLKTALVTIERARALTQQLLTFAKGGAPVRRVGSLFPDMVETVQFALSGSSISCHFDVQPDLLRCNFDKNQISQVIENLVLNAQQAMPTGGNIELIARNVTMINAAHPVLPGGDYVRISIRDYGIGIPKEIIPRIFDPFFTTKAKGHGLGLATCYSIINRHGGCIDVESQPGKGSTFHVYLPACAETIPGHKEETFSRHRGKGIFLVMDDEEAIRMSMEAMLKSFGYTVVCKDNGQDALEYFQTARQNSIHLAGIIFDLTIPGGLGGKEVIPQIRKIDQEIPVFVSSGYAEDPVMANPSDYGFTASITKPFLIANLAKLLNTYLRPS